MIMNFPTVEILNQIDLTNILNRVSDENSFKGFSAAALSNNPLNKIYSFDICDSVVLNPIPENVKFIIE